MLDAIETNRLHLQPFEDDDVEAAFGWLGDPVVMRFIPGGPDVSLEATRKRVLGYRKHQVVHGFSKWVIRVRGSAEPIGDSGLIVLDVTGAIDLGFRLARSHWGRGLATEAAEGWVRAAFEVLGIERLTAFTHRDNVASANVLRKVGFRATGARRIMGIEALTFARDRVRGEAR